MKLHDGRALLGAIALILTGILLALMLDHYLSDAQGALPRSRLWWELVLNIQILSVAMMWFCYSDRIENSPPPVKRLQIIRLVFTNITVVLPTLLGIAGIMFNWFKYEPSPKWISVSAAAVFMYWIIGLLIHLYVQKRRRTKHAPAPLRYYVAICTPIILLVGIIAVDAPRGGIFWLCALPVLTYLQGAVPFIVKAFGLREKHA